MLRALLSKAQGCKTFENRPSLNCHVGTHWKALTEYSQMCTHLPGFQSFFSFLHHFVMAKLAISTIRFNLEHLCSVKVCQNMRHLFFLAHRRKSFIIPFYSCLLSYLFEAKLEQVTIPTIPSRRKNILNVEGGGVH